MAAVAVERPSTAQERVLTANNPPPPPPTSADMGHRKRAAANARGTNVAKLFWGDEKAAAAAEVCACPATGKKSQQICPSDFLAGPREPGHLKHGVRRFDEKNECVVAQALTEEWILGRKEGDPVVLREARRRGPKDNLEGLCCRILTEEAKHRNLRAPGIAPPHNSLAPYSEPELGAPPPEKPHMVGRRRFHVASNRNPVNDIPPPAGQNESGSSQHPTRVSSRRNKANESVDVLNLAQYSKEKLNEVERKVILGPREFVPDSLPPRRRPIIARMKTHANETHDIFGTGQGVNDVEVVHRKNPGVSAPKRSSAVNIFDTTPSEQKPPKAYRPSTLLDYEEGSAPPQYVKGKARPVPTGPAPRQGLGKVEQGILFESKSANIEPRGGRYRGTYAPKSANVLLL